MANLATIHSVQQSDTQDEDAVFTLRTAVAGVSGYAGGELARLLLHHPDTLVFLTEVPGVKGADGNVMRWLTLAQIPALEKQQVVSGGMLPRLNACREALTHGVKRVRILPAEAAWLLTDLVSSRVNDGTEVMVA
ncbi:MAG: hypothetical protein ABI286_10040 [Edaphobacter sp.]